MSQPARFCIRCGAAVPVADSRFCFSCGAEIVSPGLIAEDSPLPAQEPHEEPPAAPPPSSNLGTEPQSGAIDPIQALQSGGVYGFLILMVVLAGQNSGGFIFFSEPYFS